MIKKSKKLMMTCVLIVFAGVLVGCGGKKSISGKIILETGSLKQDSMVISVGKTGIEYAKVRNYAYLLSKQYNKVFGKEIWNYNLDKEKTIGDEAREEVVSMITQMTVIKNTAKEEKIILSAEEKDVALQKAETIMNGASDEDKKDYNLSVTLLSEIFEENLLAEKMFYIATDDADTNVTDEEARLANIQYIRMLTGGLTDSGVKVSLGDKEKNNVKKNMAAVKKRLDKGEDFLTVASEKSDSKTTEILLSKNNQELPKNVIDVAMALGKGEISPVIESENGLYIVRCENPKNEDATNQNKEKIISSRQTKMFKEKYAKWLNENEVDISKLFWKEFKL